MRRADHLRDMEALRRANVEVAQAVKEEADRMIGYERLQRVAAQRGLTPYVYAVQALNQWLEERPDLYMALSPVLKDLGLLGVKVGYDPDREVALSVISAKRI